MAKEIHTDVCIVGGGPAGAMLGYLLAKQGVNVLVLEKNKTYKREFRGESISAGTVTVLDELGLLEKLREHGYLQINRTMFIEDGKLLFSVDFDRLDLPHKYNIDLPQATLIQLLVDESNRYSNYQLMMDTSCRKLIQENGQTIGLIANHNGEQITIYSSLVVGADGRYTMVRKLAQLEAQIQPFERDFVWFRLPRLEEWDNTNYIKVKKHKHMIILPTFPDLLRIGVYIPKGKFAEIKQKGLEAFYEQVYDLEPKFKGLMEKYITSWKDTTMLDIFQARVPQWSLDGLVLIGDAAHTVSPVLGQGVNLAIQDAIELVPVICDWLQKHPEKVVARQAMIPFEEKRKKDIDFIRGFQERQEKMLSGKTPMQIMKRKLFMTMLDKSPFKFKMMAKIASGRK